MPSLASVRRTGRCDCSTRRMISSFSEAGTLIPRLPHPRSCFFEQAQLQSLFGNDLLQRPRLPPKLRHFAVGGRTGRVARQPTLAGFQELLRPAVIKSLGDAFTPAQLGNAGLAPKPVQNNADLLLGRVMPPGRTADAFHEPLRRRTRGNGFLSHLRSSQRYDEPQILSSSTH